MNIQTVQNNGLVWLDVHNPQELEIKHLKKEYNFSEVHLEDYLSGQQIPKIETYKDYTLVVLDFPFVSTHDETTHSNHHYHPQQSPQSEQTAHSITDVILKPVHIPKFLFTQAKKRRITIAHVNFFISKDYLVVLHDDKTPQIDFIFEQCQKTLKNRDKYMGQGSEFLFFQLIDSLVDSTYSVMTEVTTMIDEIDLHLLEHNKPLSIVEDISITRRNIVFFKSMIEPALAIFATLSSGKVKDFENNFSLSWSSILSHLQKIKLRLESSLDLLEGISRSHESLLTARTNEIIKVLTMFTAVLLPLTLMASIYGMNIVNLPLAQDPNALFAIISTMLVVSGIMIIGFRFKKWL